MTSRDELQFVSCSMFVMFIMLNVETLRCNVWIENYKLKQYQRWLSGEDGAVYRRRSLSVPTPTAVGGMYRSRSLSVPNEVWNVPKRRSSNNQITK